MVYKLNNEKVLFTQLGDEGVLFDIEKNEYISLNETFFKILKYAEEGLESSGIVKKLQEEYDISELECTREVEQALDTLKERNFFIKAYGS